MVAWIIRVVRLLIVLVSQHRSLALENLALQQQLALSLLNIPNML